MCIRDSRGNDADSVLAFGSADGFSEMDELSEQQGAIELCVEPATGSSSDVGDGLAPSRPHGSLASLATL
eukprot:8833618-Alexandrium_andersonii.AAC.1